MSELRAIPIKLSSPKLIDGEKRYLLQRPGRQIELIAHGDSPAALMLASAGRSGRDFSHLAERLVLAGFRIVVIEAPGIGQSTLPASGELSLRDLAEDIAATNDWINTDTDHSEAFLLGRAFGNRVARTTASLHPEIVKALELIAAGGRRVLIIQGAEARIAPPQDASHLLKSQYADQVDVAHIKKAGHALLPEQPEEIAKTVIDYLTRQLVRVGGAGI